MQKALAVLHQRFVLGVRHIAGVKDIAGIFGSICFGAAKGSKVLAAGHNKGFIRVAGGNLAHPLKVFVPGQASQCVIVFFFLHAGQLVKHRHVRLDVLQMLPAVIGHTDLIQWDAQPLADQVALVITDGEHPPGKPFGGKAVEPELEAEKCTVGFHYQGADIMQHHHAAAGHEHIAGKANVKGVVFAQVARQHHQIVTILNGLERNNFDVFQFGQVQRAAIVPVAQPHIQAGALQQGVQPGHNFIHKARNARDGVTQHCAIDHNGVHSSASLAVSW